MKNLAIVFLVVIFIVACKNVAGKTIGSLEHHRVRRDGYILCEVGDYYPLTGEDNKDIVECGQSCQTKFEINGLHYQHVEKRCKQTEACENNAKATCEVKDNYHIMCFQCCTPSPGEPCNAANTITTTAQTMG